MRQFLTITLTLFTTVVCCGQTRKIILGDTAYSEYYSVSNDNGLHYRPNGSLPDGHWLIYNLSDTIRPIIETNYKDGEKNGQEIDYSYWKITEDSVKLTYKTEALYINGNKIRFTSTTYSYTFFSPTITTTDYYSLSKCDKQDHFEFTQDSTVTYDKDVITEKGYYNNCGYKNDVWSFWTANGKIYKKEIYKDGELIQTKKY